VSAAPPPPRGGPPAAAEGAPAGADAALAAAAGVDGWLTDAQARRLFARGAAAGGGQVVEIGSFRGRSTIVLAFAAGAVVAIDPHAGSDRGPQEIAADAGRGEADHAAFTANLAAAGVADRVRHVRAMSGEALGAVHGDIALLYVDGAHRFGPARDDLRRWGARVPAGGAMLVHDSFSSVGVTLALLAECVFSARWRYAGRTGSLAEYERRAVPATPAQRASNAARQLAELPYFARNLTIKLAVLAGAHGLARRLGLPPRARWPY
jgi:predicted O-methyltransferase YrrM